MVLVTEDLPFLLSCGSMPQLEHNYPTNLMMYIVYFGLIVWLCVCLLIYYYVFFAPVFLFFVHFFVFFRFH